MHSKITILNNKIDCIPGYEALYSLLRTTAKSAGKSMYVTVNNVHTMMEGFRNPSYQQIINNAYLSIPDGKPLQIVGHLKGNKEITRLFGPTVFENFIDWGRKDGIRHFFFGSSPQTLVQLKESIEKKYPGTIIAGCLAPPFAPMEEWQNEAFLQQINQSDADFIWIGLGAPKQEQWMSQHHAQLRKGVLLGIGAGFDYLAGNTQHAPLWMKNASLEWLYRLIQEPRRLWKRYFSTIPPFVLFAGIELLGFKHKLKKPSL